MADNIKWRTNDQAQRQRPRPGRQPMPLVKAGQTSGLASARAESRKCTVGPWRIKLPLRRWLDEKQKKLLTLCCIVVQYQHQRNKTLILGELQNGSFFLSIVLLSRDTGNWNSRCLLNGRSGSENSNVTARPSRTLCALCAEAWWVEVYRCTSRLPGGFLCAYHKTLPTKRNQQRLVRIIQHLRIIPNPIHGRQIPSMNRRAASALSRSSMH